MPIPRTSLIAAAALGGIAVMLGAFGAHALRTTLDAASLATWHTAVEYQFWHALALLGVGVIARDRAGRALRIACFAFVIGCVLFSGSLYALALGAPRLFGIVTPFGGVLLILGWLALGVHAWRNAPR